jgi:hypothetical protein
MPLPDEIMRLNYVFGWEKYLSGYSTLESILLCKVPAVQGRFMKVLYVSEGQSITQGGSRDHGTRPLRTLKMHDFGKWEADVALRKSANVVI